MRSYSLEDKIVIVSLKSHPCVSAIKYEITYILLEPFIKKYEIQHIEKEKIVEVINVDQIVPTEITPL